MIDSENGFEPTYENLKELAEQHRESLKEETGNKRSKFDVSELLALDKSNDPFYFGTPTQVAMGQWFRDIWKEKGYTGGKHIRRIHYEISAESNEQYYRHDGTPYVNDDDSRAYLEKAAIAARHLGYLEASDFEDMRLKAGIQEALEVGRQVDEDGRVKGTEPGFERRWDEGLEWERPRVVFEGGEASYSLPEYEAIGYRYADTDQPYRVEAWFEKEIGTKTLIPACQNMRVHLLIGVGNISVTQADLLLRRSLRDGRPVRILYFSDFDQAGHVMPVSVARQLEYLIHTKYREVEDIAMHRIAVTPDQINGRNPRGRPLPRKPVRTKYERISDPTDKKYIANPEERKREQDKLRGAHMRVKNFESRHGAGQTELNAMNERELAEVLSDAARPYRDRRLRYRLSEAEMEAQSLLDAETEDRLSHHQAELDDLVQQQNNVVGGYRRLFRRLEARMNRELAPIHERVEEIADEIEEDLEGYGEDLELPDRPEPEVEGDPDEPLYSSDRSYLEQLNYFRQYQNRVELDLYH